MMKTLICNMTTYMPKGYSTTPVLFYLTISSSYSIFMSHAEHIFLEGPFSINSLGLYSQLHWIEIHLNSSNRHLEDIPLQAKKCRKTKVELVIVNNPEFIQELLPSAQRTALLYHLSYLCLAKFPKLERILRERATETQLLFGSSEALLLKLMINLKSVIIRYDKHNHSVASCTSDVLNEKAETEKQIEQASKEVDALEKAVIGLNQELWNNNQEIGRIEATIARKNNELQNHIRESSNKNNGLSFMVCLIPFVGPLIKSIHQAQANQALAVKTQAISNELSQLSNEKSNLKNKEWNIHVRLTDMQLKLATMKLEKGSIPDPVHLNDVQTCLTRIQQILIQIKKFWEAVSIMLEALKDETFADEHFIDDCEMKETFLKTITTAQKHWRSFGEYCLSARGIFSLQTKDAYNFLETSPSSLSKEEWKRQYDAVIVKLNKICPEVCTPKETAAIA
ncbi:restin-like protein [Labeo rohita]|uniref:Restin-like protein n=1 Tax=Labeo rohita TaxID=84645 RepID=A0A498P0Q5_LABRO|nr:restin-like protein [Labeo rohita]